VVGTEILFLGGYDPDNSQELNCVFAIHPYQQNNISYLNDMTSVGYFVYEPVLYKNEIHLLSGGEHSPPKHIVYKL